MRPLSPEARGRIAFAALLAALSLIAGDLTVANGDPSVLFFLAPALAVVATGQVVGREAFLRAGISVAVFVAAGLVVNIALGRGVPDYQNSRALLTALTGLFALNLAIIAGTSFFLRRVWPSSDHWTR